MFIKCNGFRIIAKKIIVAIIAFFLIVGGIFCFIGCSGATSNSITVVLQYEATEGGYIHGQTKQELLPGQSGTQVEAVAYPGYCFMGWSDGLNDEKRIDENVTEAHTYIADFEKKGDVFIAKYHSGVGGTVSGKIGDNHWGYNVQYVHGDGVFSSTFPVTATPNDGYKFLAWSDGVAEPTRQDALQSDLSVTAYFRLIDLSDFYTVYNDKGGRVTIEYTDDGLDSSAKVTAVPNSGYVFSGWSDLNANNTRTEKTVLTAEKYVECAAFFESIAKTFVYDYGFTETSPLKNSITLNRDSLRQDCTAFVTPTRSGYVFDGWYADKDYKVKVVDCNGTYMLGYYGLSLETDTLYAKWKTSDVDEVTTFRILFLFIDSIKANLPTYNNEDIFVDVDYQMTAIEHVIFAETTPIVSQLLNDWFNGNVLFEIDMYFTLNSVTEKNFLPVARPTGHAYCPTSWEKYKFKDKYNSIAEYYTEHDDAVGTYSGIVGGCASNRFDWRSGFTMNDRHASVLEYLNAVILREEVALQAMFGSVYLLLDGVIDNADSWYFRGYHHDNDMLYSLNDIPDQSRPLEYIRDYLLNQAEGKKSGIPFSYWTIDYMYADLWDDFENLERC